MKKIPVGMAIFFLSSAAVLSQQQYGNIRGIVVDKDGVPLPGATVALESETLSPRQATTPDSGIFRFINISPGNYKLRAGLPGFRAYLQEGIVIRGGNNFDFRITLEPSIIAEEVTVVAASPIVDTKKTGTTTNVTQEMLQEIPSARDPWVILQQVPGILMDRENVGGSESGQQSWAVGRGSMSWNDTWNMDGVPITDMVAIGASPMYYDFDTFEEMVIVTGGQDATNPTGGTSLNFITRRGSNKLQVMARTFFTSQDLQSDNRTQELKDLDYVGNQINQIMDYGLQLGGPIIKDKFWFWLGYGVQDIRIKAITGYPDNTKLEGFNGKLNFQLGGKNRAEIAFLYNDKTKHGRETGPTRPPETSYDQKGASPFIKFEDEHTFSPNLLLSLKIAYQWNNWFELAPEGGMETQVGLDLATGIWCGSYGYYWSDRPSFVSSLEGNYFAERFLGGNHELKFGVEYRLTPGKEIWDWAGNAVKYYWEGEPLFAEVTRRGNWDYASNRLSFFLNDAYTVGRLTLNLGLRLDREDATNYDAKVPASKVAPDLLPAVTYPGYDPGVAFLTFSPRLGFTYDLTGDGKTILRGNIARYGSQEGPWLAYYLSSSMDAGAGYSWADLNGDNKVSMDELMGYPNEGILWFWGFDPSNPANFENLNGVDKNLKVELSDELLLGIERELFTDFSLSANLILRRNHRFMTQTYYDKASGLRITQSDYIGPITGSLSYEGNTYPYEYWTLSQFRPAGLYLSNIPDQNENYTGLEIAAVKRLSHRWMMNASFTYQVHNIHYGKGGFVDPTNIKLQDGARWWWGPNADWMAKISFLYQFPWGFNFSGFVNARQGYISAQQITVLTPERGDVGLDAQMDLFIEKPGQTRLPNFYNADLSLSKDLTIGRYGTMTLIVDAFNIFNYAHTLQRYTIVNSSRHNEIERILNPRVIRFGVRYNF